LITFGEFEIDDDAGVLRRRGARVRLQDLPFRLLVILVRRTGAVVTREELRAELWGEATFVDAEAGLNTAIAKLREALGDAADAPRFIETLPKRGYRFIGSIDAPPANAVPTSADARPRRSRTLRVALAFVVLAGIAFAAYRLIAPPRVTIAVVRFHNETGVAENDRFADSLTDAVVVALAADQRYAVIGNSPALRTERIFEDVPKIGAAVQADFVVLGQLQRSGSTLVVRAHFIRVNDQTHLWAGQASLDGSAEAERAMTSAVANGVSHGLARR